eukprot:6546892-Ditylum_brightwellii.AAC.1
MSLRLLLSEDKTAFDVETTNICLIANFTFGLIDDAHAPTLASICALTIKTTHPVTVTRTVHEIQ